MKENSSQFEDVKHNPVFGEKSISLNHWHRLAIGSVATDEKKWSQLREFVKSHALTHLPADPLWILSCLIAGPDKVIVARDEAAILSVAVVVDTCDNSANSAELLVIAAVEGSLTTDSMGALLDTAAALASAGPKPKLEFALTPPVAAALDELGRRGYERAYTTFDMRLSRVEPRHLPPPAGFGWTHPTRADAAAYHRAVLASFEGAPGVSVPPLHTFEQSVERQRTNTRLLTRGKEIVGFVRFSMTNDAVGHVDLLGVVPGWRGRKLGYSLLHEALSQLENRGVAAIELQVVAETSDAIALYRSVGFDVVRQADSFVKCL